MTVTDLHRIPGIAPYALQRIFVILSQIPGKVNVTRHLPTKIVIPLPDCLLLWYNGGGSGTASASVVVP